MVSAIALFKITSLLRVIPVIALSDATSDFLEEKKKKKIIWDFSDSNQGPIDLQSNALPAAPKSQLHYKFDIFEIV